MLGDEHVVFWIKEIEGGAFFMAAFLVKKVTVTQASCFSKHPGLRQEEACHSCRHGCALV